MFFHPGSCLYYLCLTISYHLTKQGQTLPFLVQSILCSIVMSGKNSHPYRGVYSVNFRGGGEGGGAYRFSNINTCRTSILERLISVKHLKYLNNDNNRQFTKSSMRNFWETCVKSWSVLVGLNLGIKGVPPVLVEFRMRMRGVNLEYSCE